MGIIKIALGILFGSILIKNKKKILIAITALSYQISGIQKNPEAYIKKAQVESKKVGKRLTDAGCKLWQKYPDISKIPPVCKRSK